MEVLLRVLDEALLSDLECPECMEYMAPPIKLCTNGHNICSKCREEVDCCPTCSDRVSKINNLTPESIARRQKCTQNFDPKTDETHTATPLAITANTSVGQISDDQNLQ